VEAAFVKEYGEDFFQLQQDAVKPGQHALVVDDIIATGTSRIANNSPPERPFQNIITDQEQAGPHKQPAHLSSNSEQS
jgi:hypothetical protein